MDAAHDFSFENIQQSKFIFLKMISKVHCTSFFYQFMFCHGLHTYANINICNLALNYLSKKGKSLLANIFRKKISNKRQE